MYAATLHLVSFARTVAIAGAGSRHENVFLSPNPYPTIGRVGDVAGIYESAAVAAETDVGIVHELSRNVQVLFLFLMQAFSVLPAVEDPVRLHHPLALKIHHSPLIHVSKKMF